MSSSTATASGIGLGGLGFIVLMILKLMGVIELGWFWVLTSVFWLPLLVFITVLGLIAGIGATFVGVVALFAYIFDR